MPVYLVVYGAGPEDRFGAYRYDTRKQAWLASLPASGLVPKVPPDGTAGGCVYVIGGPEDVTFNNYLLTALYNRMCQPASPVTHFVSRTIGVNRFLEALSMFTRTQEDKMTEQHAIEPNTVVTAQRTKSGRKWPVRGPVSLKEQLDQYNALLDEAAAVGVTVRKRNAKFDSIEKGEAQIAKLREKISAAAAPAAGGSNGAA